MNLYTIVNSNENYPVKLIFYFNALNKLLSNGELVWNKIINILELELQR